MAQLCPRRWRASFGLLIVILISCELLLTWIDQTSALRSGKMRRRKMRKENSARFLFVQNSKRKDYFNNTNAAEIVKSSYFDHEYELGDKIALLCIAKGEPMPRLAWFKDGNEFIPHTFSRIVERKLNATHIKSKLEIDPARQLDAGTYECHANNKYSIDRRTFKADF